jgi:hypothetical protein
VTGVQSPWQVTVADFNLDGIADFAVTDVSLGVVKVFVGQSGGLPEIALILPAGLSLTLTSGDFDNDGRPDLAIPVGTTVDIYLNRTPLFFRRGDYNDDGNRDLADAIQLLTYLYAGGPASPCPDRADVDDSGILDLADAIALLTWLYCPTTCLGELLILAPDCAEDVTDDALSVCIVPPESMCSSP